VINKVVSIVVTFNSDAERFDRLLFALSGQCGLVVIDNSTLNISRDRIKRSCMRVGAILCELGDNFGIARAQNIGVALARDCGAEFVILMDDDSIPSDSFVKELLDARHKYGSYQVVISARTISEAGVDVSNHPPGRSDFFTQCSELTSSGSLIPIEVIDAVGPFNELLFIDCVDFEWGWRARALGIQLVLCNDLFIQHRLGEGSKFGFNTPSPIRHYYQYRNVLRMIFHSKAPLRWRLAQLVKLPIKVILIILLADRRIVRLQYTFHGIYDFLIGRFGKFDR
jgi:rhamnosyltransferase